jgi:hypothetical protein
MSVGKSSFLAGLYTEANLQVQQNAAASSTSDQFVADALRQIHDALANNQFQEAICKNGTANLVVQIDNQKTYFPMEKSLRVKLPNAPLGGLGRVRDAMWSCACTSMMTKSHALIAN